MNDQFQKQLVEILKQMMISVSELKDFSLKELPDIAQQYVHYGFWSGILWVIIASLFIIISAIGICSILYAACNNTSNDVNDYAGFIFISCIILLFIILGSLLSLHFAIQNIILNITAPKVWLILEIKKLIS